jgi:hypothetical protein
MLPKEVQINLDWSEVNDQPLFYATAFATTVVSPDEVALLIGQAVAPALPGNPAQQSAALTKLKTLRVNPLGRVLLSPRHLQDLIKALHDVQAILSTIPIPAPNPEAEK